MRHQPLYLDTAKDTSRALASLGDVDLVALDTEGASFHRFVDRIYLLQLSTRDRTIIIDPLPIGVPEELGRLLEDSNVQVVFHDADYDLRLLHQDYGWQLRNVFDTRLAAQLLGIRAFGLAALLERFFGVKLEKKHQRADWSMRPLTRDMLDYAAQDTMYLLDLRDRLADELTARGRWAWAQEEFQLLENTRWDADDDANAFLRLKGARDLNRRELAVLRELVEWRNDVARRADRATFRVLGNEPLFELARLKPTTRDAIAAVKGMPRGLLDRAASDILAAIARGVGLPDAQLPRFPKAARWERDPDFDVRVSALRTVRDAAATRLDMDPGVLCSRDRLEAVARRNPSSIEELQQVPELRRWQLGVLGTEFLTALAPHRQIGTARATEPDSPYREG
jgi:ribonuclease D